MSAKTAVLPERRLLAPARNRLRPNPKSRRRGADHPVAIAAGLGAAILAAMALTPAVGPAFASLGPSAGIVEGARTTATTSRLPVPAVDFACKGQAWGAEGEDCLRAIAEQSGIRRGRTVRMIAPAPPRTDTPNVF
jgi:hypothetical protein